MRALLAALLVPVLGIIAGCGGGGAPPGDPAPESGEVAGQITGADDPTEFTLTVDGQPVSVIPDANGRFTIPGVPPGPHTIGCIGPQGAQGGYAAVTVTRGGRADVGRVRARVGGQIAGIVTRESDDGGLEPVAQAEVIATPSIIGLPQGDATSQATGALPVGRNGDPGQVVISAFTRRDGSYAMRAVPPGLYDVTVTVPGYEPQVQFVFVEAGATGVADFFLRKAVEQGVGTVKGLVRGVGVGPLEGAQITVITQAPWPMPVPCDVLDALASGPLREAIDPCPPPPPDDDPGPGDPTDPPGPGGGAMPPYIDVEVFSTLTDADGRYSLNVPTGTHWIECWKDGWHWSSDEVTIEKDRTVEVNFRLEEWDDPPPPPGPWPDPLK